MIAAFPLAVARIIAADGEWTRVVESSVDSKYVRRGIERAEASVRPAAWLGNEAWRLGAWVDYPLEEARWHEVGMTAGYAHTCESGVQIGFEVTHFHLGGAEGGHPSHTAEVAASVSWVLGPGRVTASLARDVNRRADLGEVAYAGAYPLSSWGAFLNYRLYVGSVEADDVLPQRSAARVEDSYVYHGLDLTLPYRVGGQTVLTAGLHYASTQGARPFWAPSGAVPKGQAWISLAASYEF